MKKKVFIALKMSGIAGQSKLAGIFRYLSERYGETHPWNIDLVRSRSEVTSDTIEAALKRGTDGVIASMIGIENSIKILTTSDIPTVLDDMSAELFKCRKTNLAVIHNSATEIGREAAFYFM